MFSLNVPVPGRVSRIASELWPLLVDFASIRERHTLVAKRFGDRTPAEYDRLERDVRDALVGTPTFEARITGLDVFTDPPSGTAPVVYLAVESPGLEALHDRLASRFEPVPGLEGGAYVPHVTLARGGDREAVHRLVDAGVEPVSWTVRNLVFWDARREERVSSIPLPA